MSTRTGALLTVCGVFLAACGNGDEVVETSSALDAAEGQGRPEPPMLGAHHARDAAPGGAGVSPVMSWHSGAIMPTAAVTAIFWGTSWASASFAADKLTGVDSFY